MTQLLGSHFSVNMTLNPKWQQLSLEIFVFN